jgi:hypothetical protein
MYIFIHIHKSIYEYVLAEYMCMFFTSLHVGFHVLSQMSAF